MSEKPGYVKFADLEDRLNRMRAYNRKRTPDEQFKTAYLDGYEDAVNDLHDMLAGWCGSHVRIPVVTDLDGAA